MRVSCKNKSSHVQLNNGTRAEKCVVGRCWVCERRGCHHTPGWCGLCSRGLSLCGVTGNWCEIAGPGGRAVGGSHVSSLYDVLQVPRVKEGIRVPEEPTPGCWSSCPPPAPLRPRAWLPVVRIPSCGVCRCHGAPGVQSGRCPWCVSFCLDGLDVLTLDFQGRV